MNEQDYAIISRYGAEYRGIVQYYLLAGDVFRLNRLHWVMLTSLLKTLAGKHGSSVSKMARKYAATIDTPHGPRKCVQVRVERDEGRKPLVATFGGIPLRRQKNAVLIDRQPVPGTRPRQRADPSAPSWAVRALRTNGDGASAPDPQPRGAQQARPAAARMDAGNGNTAAQDPDRLRHVPRQDPPQAANHDHDQRGATPAPSSGAGLPNGYSPRCVTGASASAGSPRPTTGRARTHAGVGETRASDWRRANGPRPASSATASEHGVRLARRRWSKSRTSPRSGSHRDFGPLAPYLGFMRRDAQAPNEVPTQDNRHRHRPEHARA